MPLPLQHYYERVSWLMSNEENICLDKNMHTQHLKVLVYAIIVKPNIYSNGSSSVNTKKK